MNKFYHIRIGTLSNLQCYVLNRDGDRKANVCGFEGKYVKNNLAKCSVANGTVSCEQVKYVYKVSYS